LIINRTIKSKKVKTIILSIFILSSFPNFFIYSINSINENFFDTTNIILNSDEEQYNSINSKDSNWVNMIKEADQNSNGLNDQFEIKLKSLNDKDVTIKGDLKSTYSNTKEKEQKLDNNKEVDFVIQFPEDFDYSSVLKIFESNEGKLKHTYKYAINGFAGRIDYYKFNDFCEILRENKILFYMEEDAKIKSNLYYNSRNMNLRPYVWDTLNGGYTGDNTSSIAILDTGIDVSHEFFDNFSNGDFRNKIVNWTDFTLGGDNNTVYDDGAHGSHVAGIAAGMGTPLLDETGRVVSTSTDFYNYTGIDISDGGALGLPVCVFKIPASGQITIECNFTDYTPNLDRTQGWAWLFKGDDLVAYYNPVSDNWENNLTYTVTSGNEGIYELWAVYYMDDGDGDDWVSDSSARFRAEVHWPFKPSTYGSGNRWQGVAPSTHLVGVKVLGGDGSGDVSWLIKGVDYAIQQRKTYNITVMSISIGIEPHTASDTSLIAAVNNAVENGIVTVVSAGNDGSNGNKTGCPGDADKVITVAAMNDRDQVTEYSSQGGLSYHANTNKPDIMAPGGSANYLQMFSADTNENDGEKYPNDHYLNDLMPAQGTSMAAPAVAGAANLLVEAMGGGNNWNWDNGDKSKLVKALLLMTATETYPLKREEDTAYSPTLDRGGKDVHEGYGRLNIGAAIQAWTNDLNGKNLNPTLYSSIENPYANHSYAGYVDLIKDQTYLFNLTVPTGRDYDLYLYNYTPNDYGEPDLIASSISAIHGQDEQINFTAKHDGKYYLVAKAIGIPSPGDDDDDDDDDDKVKPFDLVEFLTSPVGLLIIGLVGVVAIITILGIRASRKSNKYTYREY
jgi:subtilisin family serine protease